MLVTYNFGSLLDEFKIVNFTPFGSHRLSSLNEVHADLVSFRGCAI